MEERKYLRIKEANVKVINEIDDNYRKLESQKEYANNTFDRKIGLIKKHLLPKKGEIKINKAYKLLIKDKECTSRFKNYGIHYININEEYATITNESNCYYFTEYGKIKKDKILAIVEK